MVIDILKSVLVGICVSVPLGPVAIFTIQKTFSKGHIPGFVTALGATVTDTIYSAVALFALAFAQTLIDSYRPYILLFGGIVIAIIGCFMFRSNPFRKVKPDVDDTYSVKDFLQSVLMGLSNPGNILVTFGLFAFFGLGSSIESVGWGLLPYVFSVTVGSVTYWYFMTLALSKARRMVKPRTIVWISRITAIVVIGIGMFLLLSGLKMFLFK